MTDGQTAEAEILDVMRAEAQAFLDGDFEALASHWVHADETSRMVAWAQLGTKVLRGWEQVAAQAKTGLERYPPVGQRDFDECLKWDNVSIVVGTDIAWVLYDQTGFPRMTVFASPGCSTSSRYFTGSLARGRLPAWCC